MRKLEWRIDDRPIEYPNAVAEMEARVAAIRAGRARELVWLLEHPPPIRIYPRDEGFFDVVSGAMRLS